MESEKPELLCFFSNVWLQGVNDCGVKTNPRYINVETFDAGRGVEIETSLTVTLRLSFVEAEVATCIKKYESDFNMCVEYLTDRSHMFAALASDAVRRGKVIDCEGIEFLHSEIDQACSKWH